MNKYDHNEGKIIYETLKENENLDMEKINLLGLLAVSSIKSDEQ